MRGLTASANARSSRGNGATARVAMTFVLLVLLVLTAGATSFAFVQHASSAYTYGVAANARIDGHGFEAVEGGPAQLSNTQGPSVPPPVEARGASTTSFRSFVATEALSPVIDPAEVAGMSPAEVDAFARENGLIPKGPDPAAGKGAYVDPVTGEQRILCHPDGCGGGHLHVNDPMGQRLDIGGNPVAPESPAAHLPGRFSPR